MKMIPKYWRQTKILTTPQGNVSWGMSRGEIIVAGQVLGVSQCLDSAAGGDAVKLVNPVEMGISTAGGARRSRGGCRSLSLQTVPCCLCTPHIYAVSLRKPTPSAV